MGLPLSNIRRRARGAALRSRSEKGKGTRVYAEYRIGHIDRIPLGDLGGVILQLVTMNPGVDFVVTVRSEEAEGELDTRAFREVLGDIPLPSRKVRAYIKEYIQENLVTIYGGRL